MIYGNVEIEEVTFKVFDDSNGIVCDLSETVEFQNNAIEWLRKGCSTLGGGTVVRFLRTWGLSGKCRIGSWKFTGASGPTARPLNLGQAGTVD